MKKFILLYFFSILLYACQSNPSGEIIPPVLYSVQFRIQLKPEILSFDQIRSMPVNTIPEPILKSDSVGSDLYNTLEYVLYKSGDPTPIRRAKQLVGDEDFGSFLYDSLEAGSYTACFLAHSSTDVSFAENTFLFNKMEDAFFLRKSFEVDEEEEQTIDIVLERIVSRVEFVALDDVPASVTHFTMNVSPIYNRLNLLTGPTTEQTNPLLYSHLFTEEEKAKGVKNRHHFYTFVPKEATIGQVELTALTASDDTVRYRKVEAIPIAQNKLIRYTGTLYTPGTTDATFDLSIHEGGAWADTTDIVLPK